VIVYVVADVAVRGAIWAGGVKAALALTSRPPSSGGL
jgi:hypothetical protein